MAEGKHYTQFTWWRSADQSPVRMIRKEERNYIAQSPVVLSSRMEIAEDAVGEADPVRQHGLVQRFWGI